MGAAPDDLEAVIGAVMGEVLQRSPLGGNEDFFECGGDSVAAVELLQRLTCEPPLSKLDDGEQLQAALLEVIFEDASPAALARACNDHARFTVAARDDS